MIHPDTGEKIPAVFRMSCFAPSNVVLVAGMLQARSVSNFIIYLKYKRFHQQYFGKLLTRLITLD